MNLSRIPLIQTAPQCHLVKGPAGNPGGLWRCTTKLLDGTVWLRAIPVGAPSPREDKPQGRFRCDGKNPKQP